MYFIKKECRIYAACGVSQTPNKQSGVGGRKRLADSSDMFDIARSVLMVGRTATPGVNYISQEKNNYGPLGETILFSIEDGRMVYEGTSELKDVDYANINVRKEKARPQRDEAVQLVMTLLQDHGGRIAMSELQELTSAAGISPNALKNAKSKLTSEKKAKVKNRGYGRDKKFEFVLLKDE